MIFKITICRCVFYFHTKSKVPRRVTRKISAEIFTKSLHSPSGVQRRFTKRARSAIYEWMEWIDGWSLIKLQTRRRDTKIVSVNTTFNLINEKLAGLLTYYIFSRHCVFYFRLRYFPDTVSKFLIGFRCFLLRTAFASS